MGAAGVTTDYRMMEDNQNSDLILRENSMATIFDKIPSKRKLIRDTKNI